MTLFEISLILLLVTDPFGNLPVTLAILKRLAPREYMLAVLREVCLAFIVLLVFALAGQPILDYLNISQSSLSVAGGVILFIISLKMIFKSATQLFDDNYSDNPILVPIAVPFIAGPSAVTTIMILRTKEQIAIDLLLQATGIVFLIVLMTLLLGQPISRFLGMRGMNALEKFMGLLLSLIAVNMTLIGVKEFWLQ